MCRLLNKRVFSGIIQYMEKNVKKRVIGYLGAGTWGCALAALLAKKGYQVKVWDRNPDLIQNLQWSRHHPKLSGFEAPENISYHSDIREAVDGVDLIVESVTSAGIRHAFEHLMSLNKKSLPPIVVTSKGIEQTTDLLLFEVLIEVIGKKNKKLVGCLSGPSHAEEVVKSLPTSVVASSFSPEVTQLIVDTFTTADFRVYPNKDIYGVCFGGAMKNVIAIASGLSDGLGYGDNAKAALLTRGLHEMRKLCPTKKCKPATLNGLSGLGDLIVTCASVLSRNYQFGKLIAEGYSAEEAKKKIGMVVEGAYSVVSAWELGTKFNIPIPITEVVYKILYEGFNPRDALSLLFQRPIKEEHE